MSDKIITDEEIALAKKVCANPRDRLYFIDGLKAAKQLNKWVKANDYIEQSIKEAIKVHGDIKREATYGGATFIIFEDDACYKISFERYNVKVTMDA